MLDDGTSDGPFVIPARGAPLVRGARAPVALEMEGPFLLPSS